jgi:hypothetical protein
MIRLGFGSHLILASMLMEMASSIIIDLWPFDRQRDHPPDISGGVGRLNSFRYGPSDLALPDRFWIFSLGCHEENCPRSLGGYIMVIRTLDSPATSIKLSSYFSLTYWC